MMPNDRSTNNEACAPRLPPELEQKLQLCEGIVARMRVLQEQVDWEIRQLAAAAPVPEKPYEAAPAIRLAVSSVLRWMIETLKPRRA